MSKYDRLWEFIGRQSGSSILLSFAEVEAAAGLSIDHSFLRAKQELKGYGWQVSKISLKKQTVLFEKIMK